MFMLTSSFVVRIWVGIQKKQKVIHLFSGFFLNYEVSIKRVGWSQSFCGVVTTYNRQMRQMPHAEFAPSPPKKKIKTCISVKVSISTLVLAKIHLIPKPANLHIIHVCIFEMRKFVSLYVYY